MKVKELIDLLQKVNPESRVFMGYDSNIVVTEPKTVFVPQDESECHDCWWRANPGDTIILCDK